MSSIERLELCTASQRLLFRKRKKKSRLLVLLATKDYAHSMAESTDKLV
jgi:hypothetical protein